MTSEDSYRPSPPETQPDRGHRFVGAATRPMKRLLSSAVFNGETEVGIEHHGELYRLKITRQGKLILTK